MRLDGRPVGAIYGFRYRGTFGFYQTGFDPPTPVTVSGR
jgi:hypothetical protein